MAACWCADGLDLDTAVFQQAVEHAPGERAVRAAALQRQIDELGAVLRRAVIGH
jgi:hypothetical protein